MIFIKKIVRVNINETTLKVYEDGSISRKMKSGKWKEIKNSQNHCKGYNVILIEKKQYMRSKIIVHAFLNITLDDKSIYICHKDNNKLNTELSNLIIKKKHL